MNEQTELDLIERSELRLALASSNEALEKFMDIFLTPIILKLGSPHVAVRQAVLGSMKNIMARITSLQSVQLPAEKLLEQVKEQIQNEMSGGSSVSLYSLVFLSKAVDRMDGSDYHKALKLVRDVMTGISTLPKILSGRMFHIWCKLILLWNKCGREGAEEANILSLFNEVGIEDLEFLLDKCGGFLMLKPLQPQADSAIIPRGYSCRGLSVEDTEFFTYEAGVTFSREQHTKYKTAIFHFLTTFSFTGPHYWKYLLIASGDQARFSDEAFGLFKKAQPDFENHVFIDDLLSLYMGSTANGRPPVTSSLQEKILTSFVKSQYAVKDSSKVLLLASIGLNSSEFSIRSLTLALLRHAAVFNCEALSYVDESSDFSTNIPSLIRNNLHNEGWPTLHLDSSIPNFSICLENRKKQYETLGIILRKNLSFVTDLSFVEFLLESLSKDLEEFRICIQEVLCSLTPLLPDLPPNSKQKLKTSLFQIISRDFGELGHDANAPKRAASLHLVAIRYANATFPFDDCDARIINIMGTYHLESQLVKDEAAKMLQPYWFHHMKSMESQIVSARRNPDPGNNCYPKFAVFVEALLRYVNDKHSLISQKLFGCLTHSITFALHALAAQAISGKDTGIVQDEDWPTRIESALMWDIQTLGYIEEELQILQPDILYDLVSFLSQVLLGDFSTSSLDNASLESSASILLLITRLDRGHSVKKLHQFSTDIYQRMVSFETISRDLTLNTAYLYSLATQPSFELINNMIDGLRHRETSDNEYISMLYCCSFAASRLQFPANDDKTAALLSDLVTLLLDNLKVPRLFTCCIDSFSQLLKFDLIKFLPFQKREEVASKLSKALKPRLFHSHGAILTFSYLVFCRAESSWENTLLNELLGLCQSKDLDIILTAGEALTVVAAGWSSDYLFLSSQVDTGELRELKSHCSREREDVVLNSILGLCGETQPLKRKAGCIWLFSFVRFLGKRCATLFSTIHCAFMNFLADQDDVLQDMASRGLAMVYDMSSVDEQENMRKGLLLSFTDSKAAMKLMSGTTSHETQLFETGLLKTEGTESISTYRDIMNLANEVGDPSLVYKFLPLSRNSSLWSSRKGLAFGMGAILSQGSLEELLRQDPLLAKNLICKLNRYRFDPNQKISEIMGNLWEALVPSTSSAISMYSDDIIQELLEGMGVKEWRVREASTAAIQNALEIIDSTLSHERVQRIWTMTFRVMDDIKESVRQAGLKLAKFLVRRLVKSTEQGSKESALGNDSIRELLPLFLGPKGLNSDAEEIRQFTVETLLTLVKKSNSAMVPYAPELVYEFVMLLSVLEPQIINYIELNADKYGLPSSVLQTKRIQNLKSSPIFESIIQLIKSAGESGMEPLIENVIKATKQAVGLPSKVGSSMALSLTVEQYSLQLLEYSGRLLRCSYNGMEDRSSVVAASFAESFGKTANIATLKKLLKYCAKLSDTFFKLEESEGKKTIGLAIEAVMKFAPQQFERAASILMPLVFVAKNDDNKSNELFTELWNDASTTGAGTLKLYLKEVISLISENINSPIFATRSACARSACEACEVIDESTSVSTVGELYEALMISLSGRSWTGKEMVVKALVTLSCAHHEHFNNDPNLKKKVEDQLLTELSRKNLSYVHYIVLEVAPYIRHYPGNELYNKLIEAAGKVLVFIDNGELEDLSDDEQVSKRPRKQSEITKKSSDKNITNETLKVSLLRNLAQSIQVVDENVSSLALFNFVTENSRCLLQSSNVIHTWRTQVAINEIGLALSKSGGPTETLSKGLEILWTAIATEIEANETIENVKISFIRFSKALKDGFPAIADEIDIRVNHIFRGQNSSILNVELQNAQFSK
ncbi:LAMI_0F04896g1_1 [Lachancea mirantina]|uniref:LAMI_0F04896g1_1 n=1 Tax=Lachancea mirantina TaxID=1230905 RepID=A0A1G4JY12_9SACH|nr:LAMI_0F04896g1_1 [Lachancea mirantina]